MPHKSVIDLVVVNKKEIFQRYCDYMATLDEPIHPGEQGNFNKIITKMMGTAVAIPKTKKLTKCGTCDGLTVKVNNAKIPIDREGYKAQRAVHVVWTDDEKTKYHHHRRKTRINPKKAMSLISDGMDQNKTSLLSVKRHTQATSALDPVKMAVVSSLCHSHKPYCQTFVFPSNEFPKDSSLCTTIISRTLKKIYDTNGYLPPTLYLQLDNTTRENKNSTIMCYLLWLIKIGIFKKV